MELLEFPRFFCGSVYHYEKKKTVCIAPKISIHLLTVIKRNLIFPYVPLNFLY